MSLKAQRVQQMHPLNYPKDCAGWFVFTAIRPIRLANRIALLAALH
jgi:hypothetical protein